jgi:hypothetical protein
MSLIEIKVLVVYFLLNFDVKLNEEVELKMGLGLTTYPIDDNLIKIYDK